VGIVVAAVRTEHLTKNEARTKWKFNLIIASILIGFTAILVGYFNLIGEIWMDRLSCGWTKHNPYDDSPKLKVTSRNFLLNFFLFLRMINCLDIMSTQKQFHFSQITPITKQE